METKQSHCDEASLMLARCQWHLRKWTVSDNQAVGCILSTINSIMNVEIDENTVRPVIKFSDNVVTHAKRLVVAKAIYESHLNGDVLASRSTVSLSRYSVKVSPG